MANIVIGTPRDKWEEVQKIQNEPFIFIQSNGSRWAGEEAAPIAELLHMLATHTLDPVFEDYGNFFSVNPCVGVRNPDWNYSNNEPEWIDGGRLYSCDGVYRFSGNFYDCSHVFNIDTNDAETISALTAAIRKNQASENYRLAKESCGNRVIWGKNCLTHAPGNKHIDFNGGVK